VPFTVSPVNCASAGALASNAEIPITSFFTLPPLLAVRSPEPLAHRQKQRRERSTKTTSTPLELSALWLTLIELTGKAVGNITY
jgi:hypothetical protein